MNFTFLPCNSDCFQVPDTVGADIIRPRVKACISKHYPFIVNINFKQIQSERSDPKLLIAHYSSLFFMLRISCRRADDIRPYVIKCL